MARVKVKRALVPASEVRVGDHITWASMDARDPLSMRSVRNGSVVTGVRPDDHPRFPDHVVLEGYGMPRHRWHKDSLVDITRAED